MKKLAHVAFVAAAVGLAGCAPAGTNSTGSARPAPWTGGQTPQAAPDSPAPASAAPAFGTPLTPENTKIEWVGTKSDGKHTGGFGKFNGSIDLGTDPTKGRIFIEFDTESLTSDTPMLTQHLKSPDFFDVRKFPKAIFVSTQIEPAKGGEATHTITGDVTLHGVTKSISFPAKIAQADSGVTVDSKFTISRKDFGMTYGEGKVHDPVTITVKVQTKGK